MGIETGEMPAGAGGDPTAKGGIGEALREMPERQPVCPQLFFERRAEHASLNARGARGVVDRNEASEMAQVKADRALMAAAVKPGLDAADDATATAKGRHGSPSRAGPFENGLDFGLVARVGHDIGSVRIVADKSASIIDERLIVAMSSPVVDLAGAERGERRRSSETRRAQLDVGESGRKALVETVDAKTMAMAVEDERLLLGAQSLALAPPAVMLEPLHDRILRPRSQWRYRYFS